MKVSVATAVFNEAEVVPELVRRVFAVLDATPGGPHELVIVDDGSSDQTAALLEAYAAKDPRLLLISLSRNFGQQAAMSAAVDHATGDVVILMDGDLQDPPEAIPKLLELHAQGNDVVSVRWTGRRGAWLKRAVSFLFYRFIASVSDVRLPVDSGNFGLLSRRVVEVIRGMPEYHRYLRGLRVWAGFTQAELAMPRPERLAGQSKFTTRRLFGLALDGILAFSNLPLRFAALVGGLAVASCMLFVAYAVYMRVVRHESPQGFTALLVAIVFTSGVQLAFLGLIGEYLGRIYSEVKGRPVYVVKRIVKTR